MRRLALLLILAAAAVAQTVSPGPDAGVPTSLTAFADQGDLTYCVATPLKGTTPQFSFTCRRSGVTYLTASLIKETTFVSAGDLLWEFLWDPTDSQKVRLYVAESIRTDGKVTGNKLRTEAVVTWPVATTASRAMRIVKAPATLLRRLTRER